MVTSHPRPDVARSFAKLAWTGALASALLAAGCVVSTDDAIPVVTTGRLTLRWTINGTVDPFQCRQAVAPTLRIRIFSGFASDYVQSCEAFATTIDLNPGDYSGSVYLEDGSGQPRTTSIELAPFRIIGGTNLDIPVDFPADSFF